MSDELRRGIKLGRYELLQRIGRGGMATVWVARERGGPEGDRLVAVKAILADLAHDQEFVNMFLDEGRLVQMIRHGHVVDVYEVGEHEGTMFMAMEWVEGDSLHALIAEAGKRRPIPPEHAVRIIADAAAGLHAAHELKDNLGNSLNVVHRDVSPHNILVGTNGTIKLVDFGVAKAMGRLGDATVAGQLKGKFGYMSPEQARGKAVDRRADVFALGIVLFELTTGRRLFRGEHDAETLHLVVSGKIPEPRSIDPQYPEQLEAIVMRALERDLDKRYQTAKELSDALEQYLAENRIIVARQGLGSLLMKVLGKRIEQRRKAIKASLRIVDGRDDQPVSDPGALPSDSVSSVTGSALTGSALTDSALSSTSGLSSQSSAGISQSVPQQPTRRSGFGGYLIGIAGLAVAVIVLVLYATSRKGTTTTIVNVPAAKPAPAAQPSPAPTAPEPEEKDDEDDGVETVDIDALEDTTDEGKAGATPRPRTKPSKASSSPDPAPKPAPKPSEGTGDLPRANPYK